jgi:hypothetical protein
VLKVFKDHKVRQVLVEHKGNQDSKETKVYPDFRVLKGR